MHKITRTVLSFLLVLSMIFLSSCSFFKDFSPGGIDPGTVKNQKSFDSLVITKNPNQYTFLYLIEGASSGSLASVMMVKFDVDANTLKVIKTLPLNFECRIAGNDASHVYLFGVKGGMYSVDFQLSKVTSEKLPFSQPVTTCNFNIENGDKAFGTSDGTIYYFEPSGQMHRLVGHRSRISRVKFENDLLFSTSYDGTVKFWNTSYDKIEPITVMNTNQWIGTFTVSKDKEHIWTGDQNGNLNYTTISVELMADKVLANLKRNFTQEEWEYYIGNQIPFETFINKGK